MKPLLPLSYLKSLPLYKRITPRRRALFLILLGTLLASSIALFAIRGAQASNQAVANNGNAIELDSSRSPFVTRIAKFGFLAPLSRYIAPSPTAGVCDTAGPIEVESSGGT